MLFRAAVHKCPKCGSYAVGPLATDTKSDDRTTSPDGLQKPDVTRIKTKPRLRGYIVPQTPTPMQGESAISKEMLRKMRGEDEEEVVEEETPTNDDPMNLKRRALEELEAALGTLETDATVEIPNPLSAGLDFSSDVFFDDRADPSIERKMPELRNDPSVEQRRPELPSDLEEFVKAPTKPKTPALPSIPKAKVPPPAPFAPPREQLELEDAIVESALSGLESLRDPEAGLADPSLILDLQALSEEEIELERSLITGEREVRSTRRLENVVHEAKIEISPEMAMEVHVAPPKPSPPSAKPPELPTVTPPPLRTLEEAPATTASLPPRIGSRLSAAAAALSFGGAAALALLGSITAVGGWISVLAVGVVAWGAVRKDLGWKDELLHVIAAGAAVASAQPWALDLAQIGQSSFWRTPAAMACVGALIVGLTLLLLAAERSGAKGSSN